MLTRSNMFYTSKHPALIVGWLFLGGLAVRSIWVLVSYLADLARSDYFWVLLRTPPTPLTLLFLVGLLCFAIAMSRGLHRRTTSSRFAVAIALFGDAFIKALAIIPVDLLQLPPVTSLRMQAAMNQPTLIDQVLWGIYATALTAAALALLFHKPLVLQFRRKTEREST